MNYYINGDAAKAEQIRAAFEKLGYDISWPGGCANPDVINIGVERNGAKYVVAETSEYIKDIIKTHPDYKELKLHVEPEFKVGDWIANDYCAGKVIALTDDVYLLDSGQGIPFSCEHNAHLWTIQDAKDGDVLVDEYTDTIGIFEETNGIYWNSKIYCGKSTHTKVYHHGGSHHIKFAKPATKEQRILFFKKMQEAGYQWYAGKKELRKIQPHYDISNFHAGMPVLVRDRDNHEWNYVLFSHCTKYSDCRFGAGSTIWHQCIPFNEDTKHLLGTTDMCDERFINW